MHPLQCETLLNLKFSLGIYVNSNDNVPRLKFPGKICTLGTDKTKIGDVYLTICSSFDYARQKYCHNGECLVEINNRNIIPFHSYTAKNVFHFSGLISFIYGADCNLRSL